MSKFQFRYICMMLWFIAALIVSPHSYSTILAAMGMLFGIGAIYSACKERKEARQ